MNLTRLTLLSLLLLSLFASASLAQAPGAVTLVSPAGGEQIWGFYADFLWSGDESAPQATWYYLWVARNGSTYLRQWVEGNTAYYASNGLAGGNYEWWVRSWNASGYGPWSARQTFTVTAAIPGAPNLVTPINGAIVEDSRPLLDWTPSNPNARRWQVWVNRNNAQYWTKQATMISSTSPDMDFASGSYQWWVRAWSPNGYSPWSSVGTFTIPGLTPGAVALISPTGGGCAGTLRPRFRWAADTKATWYYVWINRNGQSYRQQWVQGATNWTPASDLSQGGNFQWWVRTWNAAGYGPWSAPASFTTPIML